MTKEFIKTIDILEKTRTNYRKAEELKNQAKELTADCSIEMLKTNPEEFDRLHKEADELYKRAEHLAKVNAVMIENARFYFAKHCTAVLSEIFGDYDGKQYGEKTARKIYERAKEQGFYISLDGSICNPSKWYIKALLRRDYDFFNFAVEFGSGAQSCFISESNTINADAVRAMNNKYKLAKNAESRVKQLEKAMTDYKKAVEVVQAKKETFNALAPCDCGITYDGNYTGIF